MNNTVDYNLRRKYIYDYLNEFKSIVQVNGYSADSAQIFKQRHEDLLARTSSKQIADLQQEEKEFYWALEFLGMYNTNYVKWSITNERLEEFIHCYTMVQNGGARALNQILNTQAVSQRVKEQLNYCWGDLISNTKSSETANYNPKSSENGSLNRLKFIESVRISGLRAKNGSSLADLMYDFVRKCKMQKVRIVCDGIMPRNDVWDSEVYLDNVEDLFDTEQIDGKIYILASLCNTRSKRFTKSEVYVGDYNRHSLDTELTNELQEIVEALQYDIYASGANYYSNAFYKFVLHCCQGRFSVYTGVIARILTQTFSGYGSEWQAFGNIVYGWFKFYNLPIKGSEFQKPMTDEQRVQAICPPQEIRMILMIYSYVMEGRHLLVRQTVTKHSGLFFSKKEVQYRIVADLRFWQLIKIRSLDDNDVKVMQGMQCLRERLFNGKRKDLQIYITDDQLAKEAIANPSGIDNVETMYNDLDSDFIVNLKALPRNGFLYNFIKQNILAYNS